MLTYNCVFYGEIADLRMTAKDSEIIHSVKATV